MIPPWTLAPLVPLPLCPVSRILLASLLLLLASLSPLLPPRTFLVFWLPLSISLVQVALLMTLSLTPSMLGISPDGYPCLSMASFCSVFVLFSPSAAFRHLVLTLRLTSQEGGSPLFCFIPPHSS